MRLHPHTATRRPGFTLIEVLVAAGLCMLIMSVLAAAFASGIDTFSLLKSTGELNERLKVAAAIMRADLQAPHLEAETGEPVKVSQLRYDQYYPGSPDRFARPQPRGFFRVQQEGPSTAEGNDLDGLPSTRASGLPGQGHVLHMAVRLPGTRIDRAFTAKMPQRNVSTDPTPAPGSTGPGFLRVAPNPDEQGRVGQLAQFSLLNLDTSIGANPQFPAAGQFVSQWGEVAYFLSQQQTSTAGGTPLFSLHRRVRALLPKEAAGSPSGPILWKDPTTIPPANAVDFTTLNNDPKTDTVGALGMSTRPSAAGSRTVNTITDVGDPNARLGQLAGNRGPSGSVDLLAPLGTGEDIMLINVVSFEVKAAWDGMGGSAGGGESPFADLPPIPSIGKGATQTQGGNTITFPFGSGNNGDINPAADTFFRTVGGTVRVFDTWTTSLPGWDAPTRPGSNANEQWPNPNNIPLMIRLKAVQIKLRVYDPKNKLTRQVTLVQDL